MIPCVFLRNRPPPLPPPPLSLPGHTQYALHTLHPLTIGVFARTAPTEAQAAARRQMLEDLGELMHQCIQAYLDHHMGACVDLPPAVRDQIRAEAEGQLETIVDGVRGLTGWTQGVAHTGTWCCAHHRVLRIDTGTGQRVLSVPLAPPPPPPRPLPPVSCGPFVVGAIGCWTVHHPAS
jgi:hypothetical protein